MCFSSISRVCARQRPAPRPDTVSWSLNRVLDLTSQIAIDQCSFQHLLRKTLFLVALASGARISELAALSREEGFVTFLFTGEASLAPHPKFLAKNEDPAYGPNPWTVVPLPHDPSRCPVQCLETNLSRAENISGGRLFRVDLGGALTLAGIRQHILYFIQQADPESFPKAHDVRPIATSVQYFHFMDFPGLSEFTEWISAGVFIKHYCENLEALRFHTVAAGKVVPPMSSDLYGSDAGT